MSFGFLIQNQSNYILWDVFLYIKIKYVKNYILLYEELYDIAFLLNLRILKELIPSIQIKYLLIWFLYLVYGLLYCLFELQGFFLRLIRRIPLLINLNYLFV